jgi:hypothetical protein
MFSGLGLNFAKPLNTFARLEILFRLITLIKTSFKYLAVNYVRT